MSLREVNYRILLSLRVAPDHSLLSLIRQWSPVQTAGLGF